MFWKETQINVFLVLTFDSKKGNFTILIREHEHIFRPIIRTFNHLGRLESLSK